MQPLLLTLLLLVAVLLPRSAYPDDSSTTRTLTVLTHNILTANRDRTGVIRQILDTDPDIVCLQEVTSEGLPSLRAALEHRYPYFVASPRARWASIAVFSKEGMTTRHITGTHWAGSVTVRGREYQMLVVHLPSLDNYERNLPSMYASYARTEKARLQQLERHLTDPRPPGPFLAVGDFNTLPLSPVWQRLHREGLRDAALHDADGLNAPPTYHVQLDDNTTFGVRIDYIFASPHLRPIEVRLLDPMGSDHHPLLATLHAP